MFSKHNVLFIIALLSLPQIGIAQCQKVKVKELIGFVDASGAFLVIDSVAYFYDDESNLVRSETHQDIHNDDGIRYTSFFEAKGDLVIREKVLCDLDFVPVEHFMQDYPGTHCLERLGVNSMGDTLAYEDMSDNFYGMKNWDGIDSDGVIYCKYQSDANSKTNPELFYTYRDIDGEWIVYEISIMDKNEQGDFTTVQTVISGGYGYSKTEYRYKYDACGNWIEKEQTGASGKFHLVAVREIDYRD